jgi:hypothetical protein
MGSDKGGIVWTLVLAVAFAAGLCGYLYHVIPSREELLAGSTMPEATSAAFAGAEALDARVKAKASAFVTALAEGRASDAYVLMAAPYRAVASEAVFETACRSSPFLAKPESVTIHTVRESVAPGGAVTAITATGVLASAAGGVPIRFGFLDEREQLGIISVVVADAPVLTARAP